MKTSKIAEKIVSDRSSLWRRRAFFERIAVPMIREDLCAESRGRKSESAARSTVTGRVRAFGIKASRVIDWCSGGYTQRHVPIVASTDVAAVCAWELLKAERIRQEKAAAG